MGMSDSGRQGLASLEPRHGRDTTSWHLVNKPSQPGRQTVREPSPSHLSNATIPTQRLKCAIRRFPRGYWRRGRRNERWHACILIRRGRPISTAPNILRVWARDTLRSPGLLELSGWSRCHRVCPSRRSSTRCLNRDYAIRGRAGLERQAQWRWMCDRVRRRHRLPRSL